jgi:hypothetical protein
MVSNMGTLYVSIPIGRAEVCSFWAKEYCPGYITNDLHMDGYNTYDSTRIDYFFGSEEDAIAFKLKFGI